MCLDCYVCVCFAYVGVLVCMLCECMLCFCVSLCLGLSL
jgi:hypothetical protein